MPSPTVRFMSSRSCTTQPDSTSNASIFSRALASGAFLLPVGDIAQSRRRTQSAVMQPDRYLTEPARPPCPLAFWSLFVTAGSRSRLASVAHLPFVGLAHQAHYVRQLVERLEADFYIPIAPSPQVRHVLA